jgi:hypothetical protein
MKRALSTRFPRMTAALLGLGLVSIAAYAAVTFNAPPAGDCSGFVGKGDVQNAFGWNNAQLQANAANVTFTYEVSETVQQECTTTGMPPHVSTGQRTKSTSLNSSLNGDPRKTSGQQQFTGFNLNPPCGTTTTSDTGWVGPNGETSGTACPPGSTPQGPQTVTSSVAGLFAHFGNQTKQLQ